MSLLLGGESPLGYAISWLAVRSENEGSALAALGLEKTGETEKFPESDWSCTRLSGWTVVWSESCEPAQFRGIEHKLSCEVVVCDVEEHVMFVSVAAYENAILNWRIIHDAQKANDHLFVEGKPPESLERIQPEELARVHQDLSVDFIFEIPLRVAKELVGFRHEEATGVFEILREISPTKARPRWKFW